MLFYLDSGRFSFQHKSVKFNLQDTNVVRVIDPNGEEITNYQNRVPMIGKDGLHNLQVRTMKLGNVFVLEGALYAYLFGQNLFTSSQLKPILNKVLNKVLNEFNFNLSPEVIETFKNGVVKVDKIDIAVNYRLKSEADVMNTITQIRRYLVENKHTVRTYDGTVVFTPNNGREYSISFYAKGPELAKHRKYRRMPWRAKFLEEASNILRVEVRVHAEGLRKAGLDQVHLWEKESPKRLFLHYFDSLPAAIVTSLPLDVKELSGLPTRLRPVMALHKLGASLTEIYSKSTLNKHLRFFKREGLDLSKANYPDLEVKSIKELLCHDTAICKAPKWMRDLGLMHVPKKAKGST